MCQFNSAEDLFCITPRGRKVMHISEFAQSNVFQGLAVPSFFQVSQLFTKVNTVIYAA